MAHSVVIPVDVEFNMDKAQLKSISKAIDMALKKKNIKAKDFFAPINNSAKKLSVNLKGLKFGDFFNKFSSSAKNLSSNLLNINNSVKSLSSSFSGLRRIATQALSIAAIGNVGKKMIELSSDIIEIQNVVDTVFGEMANDINDFAKSALKSFGLTQLQAKNFASVFGGLLEASDITGEAQKEMSINLTKLTGDVASFYNLDYDEVFNKLQSGLTGEVKAMRAFGVNMTIANMEAWALSKGITSSYDSMNQAEKTALRYNYMLEKLANAQGDFSKTQGSWANQTRILVSQVQQLGGILGGFLQKVLYPVVTVINQILSLAISGATALAKMFGFDMESLQVQQGVADASAGVALGDTGADAMDDLADSTDGATKAQKKLNKEQNKSLANIHELNVLSSNKSSESSGSSGGGAGGVGGAGIGDIGFDLSKYKDIPEKDNPINNLFKNLENAVKNNDWRGIGSLLADELNELMSKIDLAQYIPAVEKGAFALAEILNGFVQNIHFDEIGRIIGEGANLIMAAVNKFYDQFDFISLGQQIARGFNSLFDTVDFEALGQFLVNKFNAVFQTLAGFVTTFDWKAFADSLVIAINSAISNLDAESFATALIGIINGIITVLITLIQDINWGELADKIFYVLKRAISEINWSGLFDAIISAHEELPSSIALVLDGLLAYKAISKLIPIITNVVAALSNLKVLLNGGLIEGKSLTFFQNLGNAIALTAGGAGTLHEALEATFGGVATTLAGVGSVIVGAITAVSNFIDMLKEGFSWVKEIIMIIGIAVAAVGAVILGAPAAIAALVAGIVASLATLIVVIKDNWNAIVNFFSNLVSNIGNWLSSIWTSISTWFTTLVTNVATWIGGIWKSISTWFTNLVTNIVTWFSNIWTSISNWFTKLVTNISTWLGNIWTSISTWFTNLLTNVGTWLGNILTSLISWFTSLPSKINGLLSSVGSTISGWFSSVWTNFTSFLGNIISYITGTFKTAWSGAWNGIKDVFSGLFDTIGGIFKGVINTVVDAINTVINAINKVSWDVPDWVPGIGGSTFGFSIPTVPKLAQGAVIPPNQEFLAILGDQKRGINIETPLDTMLQAFRGALAEFTDYNGGDIIIPIYINNELSSEEIIRRHDIARYRSNGK